MKNITSAAPIKKMDPNRFVIGERVRYVNHVTGQELGVLKIVGLDSEFVVANKFFARATDPVFKFRHDGSASWSSNLSILHT